MTKPMAIIRKCTDHMPKREHNMLDHCWDCAPFWDSYPVCPTHRRKLHLSGWCRDCRRYYSYTTPGR